MDNISFDSGNPFLYLAGAASVSMLINVYCCLRKCKNNNNDKKENLTQQDNLNQISNIELTEQFQNVVIPNTSEDKSNTSEDKSNTSEDKSKISKETQTHNVENYVIDIETGNRKTDVTTQTEDCELYDMMGERFSQELDYYKAMNMKKK